MVRVSLPTICVVPNIEKRYNSMRVLRAVGAAIAILAFAGVIAIMAVSFSDASDGMILPFIPIPMLCIMAGMLILAFGNYKAMQYARVKAAVNTIKSRDKILLLDVFSMESNSIELAQAMLDTGNLPGYELVGSVMLAKTELHVSEEEAVAEHNARLQSMPAMMGAMINAAPNLDNTSPLPEVMPPTPITPAKDEKDGKPRFCTQCGTALAETDKFCPSCGAPVSRRDGAPRS